MKLAIHNKKFIDENGKLFFYTADTAWEIFHKLTFKEAQLFINNRRDKGFNVIQAVVVAELDGIHTPTYEAKLLPFSNLETLEVNEAYFDHVKNVIKYANSQGLFIALVPMWDSYLIPNLAWGGKVKPLFDKEKASKFVDYLSKKFIDLDIIWLLGGDRSYITKEHQELISSMAKTIRKNVGSAQLISAHTQGGRSLYDMLDKPDYLDFLTWQSGHMGKAYPSWRALKMIISVRTYPFLMLSPVMNRILS